jgi:hypothetical protein
MLPCSWFIAFENKSPTVHIRMNPKSRHSHITTKLTKLHKLTQIMISKINSIFGLSSTSRRTDDGGRGSGAWQGEGLGTAGSVRLGRGSGTSPVIERRTSRSGDERRAPAARSRQGRRAWEGRTSSVVGGREMARLALYRGGQGEEGR